MRRRPKWSDRLPSTGEARKVATAITSPIHAPTSIARQAVDPPDLHHQLWQHGHDDAETHRIHENRRDDEWNGACCRHLFFTLTVISATEPPSCVADR